MTIETRFSVYDKIWFLHEKRVVETEVRGMKIEYSKRLTEEKYDLSIIYLCSKESDTLVYIKVGELDAFATKELLLQSL